jgi:hypothetical protein
VGPAWIPWASQEVQKPVQDMPTQYEMAIFDLYQWKNPTENTSEEKIDDNREDKELEIIETKE